MSSPNPVYRVGDATVTRIDEVTLKGFTPAMLYPGSDPAVPARFAGLLGPGSVEPGAGTLVMSVHSWLVRTPDVTVLIDTGAGNGKPRGLPVLADLHEPFLERLAAAGVAPGDVDAVLMTHLHADHVGWNTARADGTWRPVFPRARHLFSPIEGAYNAALARGEDADPERFAPGLGPMARRPSNDFFADSVRPVIEAGLAEPIDVSGDEVLPGLAFVPSPGHSIDHASIRLRSRGAEALFLGDLLHHPLQVYAPELRSCFCEFPAAAEVSRRRVLAELADSGALAFTTHFAETSVGRVDHGGDGFTWTFA